MDREQQAEARERQIVIQQISLDVAKLLAVPKHESTTCPLRAEMRDHEERIRGIRETDIPTLKVEAGKDAVRVAALMGGITLIVSAAVGWFFTHFGGGK